MNRLFFIHLALCLFLFCVSAAQAGYIPETGQTKCYDTAGAEISCAGTGQDGENLAGTAWPTTRFTDNGDQSISDAMTGLTWAKDGNLPGPAACGPTLTRNWLGAQDYINCLNLNGFLGKNDWRMPSINELRSLINYGAAKQSTWLIASGFTSLADLDYWSSTSSAANPAAAWTLTMGTGGVTNTVAKSTAGYVLPVRGGIDAVSVLPSNHSFGSITVNSQSPAKEFKITNGGTTDLTISAITIGGSDPTQFTVAPGGSAPCANLTPSIPGNSACTIQITFAPTAIGPKEATLSITSNSVSRPSISAPITGISTASGITVSAETGQTKCYDTTGAEIACAGTGQDGENLAGTAWPTTRFTDNGDQSISDTMTGLTWVKDGNLPGPAACGPTITRNWLGAQDYINCLNLNGYLGKNDWRMPSINELRSLINYGAAKQSTWLIASGFTGLADLDYWSSTSSAQALSQAWTLNMGTGGVTNTVGKSTAGYVLPVRGGIDAVYLLPLSHSFGSITSGAVSTAKEFKITNGGTTDLTISAITIGGSDPTQFTVAPGGTSPCASLAPTLAAGGSCTLAVVFAPSNIGPKEATLTIASNSSSRPVIDIPLTGISRGSAMFVSPETGQTKCYDTAGVEISCLGSGQDGELTGGTTWPASRFSVNASQGISDYLTGLVWGIDGNMPGPAACAPGVTKKWLDALTYVACLNQNKYLGKNDWRMPSINELRSLINYGAAKQSTWLIALGFTTIKDLDYWSSTSSAANPAAAWTLTMGTGGVTNTIAKTTAGYVLPVRGGTDAVSVLPASHNFGNVLLNTTATKEFQIVNDGAIAINISGMEITGTDAARYSMTPGGAQPCAGLAPVIEGNSGCTVNVTFAPTGTLGTKAATLRITSDSKTTPAVDISLTGIAPDVSAPTVAVTAPANGASGSTLWQITGTAGDNVGVSRVEVQITNSIRYLAANGQFTSTSTWITATTQDNWQHWALDTANFALNSSTSTYAITARAFDAAGNVSQPATVSYTNVSSRAYTQLAAQVAPLEINPGGTAVVSGKLSRLPDDGSDLSNLPVTITITRPDGTQLPVINVTTSDSAGNFQSNVLNGFNLSGLYTFDAFFEGTTLLASSAAPKQSLMVGISAGYAIVVTGKRSDNSLLDLHTTSIDNILATLKKRGFQDANILALKSTNTKATNRAELQSAITVWAKEKLAANPAPLYLIMIDHGSPAGFVLGTETLTPNDLKGWFDALEADQSITAAVSSFKRVIVIGSCYSGQFQQPLSKPGRIIITSAGDTEESIAGVKLWDVSSSSFLTGGEYFIDSLFSFLGRGDDFKSAFVRASGALPSRDVRRLSQNELHFGVWDALAQHPLLDDDGDGIPSYRLDGIDGNVAAALKLGEGIKTNAGANPADVIAATPATTLSASATTATLWLAANLDARVGSAWVEIRTPDTAASGTGSGGQVVINTMTAPLMHNTLSGRWETIWSGFSSPGRYDIFYYTIDSQTGELSSPAQSTIYKNKSGNTAPAAFDLTSPADRATPNQAFMAAWSASTDSDALSYRLEIADDQTFANIFYSENDIAQAATVIPDTALMDGATGLYVCQNGERYCYWRVKAIDSYGATTISTSVRSFTVVTTNSLPGFIKGFVVNSATAAPIPNAAVSANGDTPLNSLANGAFLIAKPAGSYSLTAAASGFVQKTVTATAVSGKVASVTFSMTPISSKPGDCDNDGMVTIAEVQSAINMFLGLKAPAVCVDTDNNSSVSIAEVQKAINSFLGL